MIIPLWRNIKTIPYLRECIASIYYFFHKNYRNICGDNNFIQVNLQDKFPFIKNSSLSIIGNDNTVVIKSGCCISNMKVNIKGNKSLLIIEENCIIGGGCLWIDDSECQLVIGKETTINEANIGISDAKSSIVIGENCMFAHGVDIRCGDSHSIIDLKSNTRINYAQDININNHVWIAMNVHILKGVTIGKNSIVGAGSIVTKDIPENCIAVGVPADVKKTGVTWVREKIN